MLYLKHTNVIQFPFLPYNLFRVDVSAYIFEKSILVTLEDFEIKSTKTSLCPEKSFSVSTMMYRRYDAKIKNKGVKQEKTKTTQKKGQKYHTFPHPPKKIVIKK